MNFPRLVFLKEFLNTFHTTGAIAPSGRWLARKMVEPLLGMSGPRRVLEAGPGTGVFSHYLIQELRPGDEFTLCEINPVFAEFLRNRLNENPTWREKQSQVRVVCTDIRDLFLPSHYDFIVSGLPLNNFSPDFVHELLLGFVESLKPQGVHTYFEYQAVRDFRRRWGSPETRNRLEGVQEAIDSLREKAWVSRKSVILNLPPAYAYEIRPHTVSKPMP